MLSKGDIFIIMLYKRYPNVARAWPSDCFSALFCMQDTFTRACTRPKS